MAEIIASFCILLSVFALILAFFGLRYIVKFATEEVNDPKDLILGILLLDNAIAIAFFIYILITPGLLA